MVFGAEASHKVEVPNRDLLLDFCWSRQMVVANTLLPGADEVKATFYVPGAAPMDTISSHGFSMLDILLMPALSANRLVSISSDRTVTIASHHFPVVANIACTTKSARQPSRPAKLDWECLRQPTYREAFTHEVSALIGTAGDVDTSKWSETCAGVLLAAKRVLPAMTFVATKQTMDF